MATVSISTYGVVANSAADQTAAINAAIAQAKIDGNDLIFDDGSYRVSGEVRLADGVSLFGASSGTTRIYANPGEDAASFSNGDYAGNAITSIEISGFDFDNVIVELSGNVVAGTISDNIFYNTNAQFQMRGINGDFEITDNIFLRTEAYDDGSGIANTRSEGIKLFNADGTNISGNIFGGLSANGADTALYTPELQARLAAFAAANPSVDLYDAGYYTSTMQGTDITGITINQNIIVGTEETGFPRDHAIYFGNYSDLTFAGNYVAGWVNDSTGGVKLRNGDDTYVYNNYFDNISLLTYTYDNITPHHLVNTYVFNNTFVLEDIASTDAMKPPIYYVETSEEAEAGNGGAPTTLLTLTGYYIYNNNFDLISDNYGDFEFPDISFGPEVSVGETVGTQVFLSGNSDRVEGELNLFSSVNGIYGNTIPAGILSMMNALAASLDQVVVIGRPAFANIDASFDYTEGDGAIIIDANAAVSDANYDALNGGAGNYSGAVLTVTRSVATNTPTTPNTVDMFGFAAMTGVTVSGNTLVAGGKVIATFSTADNSLRITFTDANGGKPTTALVNQILSHITYENQDQTVPEGIVSAVAFTYTMFDGTNTAYGAARVSLVATDSDDLFSGTAGNDVINAGIGNDTVNAGLGDDTVFGGAGDDLIRGNDGNDTLHGDADNDTIQGGNGSDTIYGDAGADFVDGGDGADMIEGGDGNDDLRGNTGNDTIRGDAGADSILGNEGNDRIYGGLGNDTINGNDGDDTIDGDDGADNIRGGAGTDLIRGGNDNDVLRGEDGADTIYGGAGDDFVEGGLHNDEIHGGDGVDDLRGDEGNDTIYGDVGADAISGNEGNDRIYGGLGADTINGNDGNDTIDGDDGADNIRGGVGVDLIRGGNDNDILRGEDGADTIYGDDGDDFVEGGLDDDRIYGGAGIDDLRGNEGNDTIFGGDGNDTLNGHDGNDTLQGDAGDDRLTGGAGSDTLYGNAGADKLYADDGDDSVFGGAGADYILLGAGNDTADGGDDNDTIFGDVGDDTIRGGAGNDTIGGQDGADILIGGAGDDTLDGGSSLTGLNTIDYSQDNATSGVTVTLRARLATDGLGGTDTIRNINIVIGSDLSDTLDAAQGSVQTDTNSFTLYGRAGNDTLIGDAGMDYLSGGAGDDQINGGGGRNYAVYSDDHLYGATSGAVVDLSTQTATDGFGGHDTFVNISSVIGSGLADNMTGDDNQNYFEGGAGNDFFGGRGGDDFAEGGDGADSMYGGLGNDQLRGDAGNDYIVGNEGNDFIAGGQGSDELRGYAGADRIYGNEGNDRITGDAGNDYLVGNEGDDRIEGGTGNDELHGREGADSLFGGDGRDRMLGYEDNDWLEGGNDADLVAGNDGDDTLYGQAGDDRMYGGLGNDLLYGGDDNDYMVGNQDDDTLYGQEGNDSMHGRLGNDILYGGGGNDYMKGGTGDDILDGGDKFDSLYGEEGTDTFQFTGDWRHDKVMDWEEGETLDLSTQGLRGAGQSNADAFAKLTVVQDGDDTLINITGDSYNSIRLIGINASTIDAADFDFGSAAGEPASPAKLLVSEVQVPGTPDASGKVPVSEGLMGDSFDFAGLDAGTKTAPAPVMEIQTADTADALSGGGRIIQDTGTTFADFAWIIPHDNELSPLHEQQFGWHVGG